MTAVSRFLPATFAAAALIAYGVASATVVVAAGPRADSRDRGATLLLIPDYGGAFSSTSSGRGDSGAVQDVSGDFDLDAGAHAGGADLHPAPWTVMVIALAAVGLALRSGRLRRPFRGRRYAGKAPDDVKGEVETEAPSRRDLAALTWT